MVSALLDSFGLFNPALLLAAFRNSSSKNEGINREGRSKFHTLRKWSAPLNLTQGLAYKHAATTVGCKTPVLNIQLYNPYSLLYRKKKIMNK